MIKISSNTLTGILLGCILITGAIFRFCGYSDFPLNGDELGALSRLRFSSFADLIEQGVKTDGHPPLVLVFLFYWTKIFELSEAAIRFPFALCGIFSIYFLYLIGAFWFNRTTGLLAAAALATLEFPLIYTQIARPYAPGLLFTLMNTWFWTKLLFDDKSQKKSSAILYGITASLCMLTHYFSFLSVVIAGLSGLLFVKRETIKYYLIGGGIAFLLFIPALDVFYYQFFVVGGWGWLSKPEPGFFWKYLFIFFNNSVFLAYFVGTVSLSSLVINSTRIKFSRFHAISLLWFLLPCFIGYYYSIYRNPVLQDKLLLFSFPFLLLFLFSFFRIEENRFIYSGIVLGVLAVFSYNTAGINSFFSKRHFDEFTDVAHKTIEYIDKYGEQNITRTINVFDPYYINYYFDRLGRKVTYSNYQIGGPENFLRFDSLCRKSSTPYFLFSWWGTLTPCEILQIIRQYFPYTVHKEFFERTEIYLFAKEKSNSSLPDKIVFRTLNNFEANPPMWSTNDSAQASSLSWSGTKAAKVNATYPYSPTFSAQATQVLKSVDDIIYAGVRVRMNRPGNSDIKLCISFEEKNGIYGWHDIALSNFVDSGDVWRKAFIHSRVPKLKSKNDIIKIFVWSAGGNECVLDDFEVWIEEGNPVLWGKRSDHGMLD
ncbi:MAG: glycosyltransferase family 39 protein [Bacteroidetes bacterium]|nr:glycosyltransferase family 39 protein [Bacteroidota bacterium]